MASVETAVSTVARPGLLGRIWHWRYELGLAGVVLGGATVIGVTLGLGWLAVTAAVMTAIGAAAAAWPVSRRRLIARAWCVITPHRIRTGCAHAWVQTRGGRLPVVIYTVPADFGERVWLWCRAGIVAADLAAARDVLRAACWASDVRVVVNDRRSHIVVLEVIRRAPDGRPPDSRPDHGWPYLDRAPRDQPDRDPGRDPGHDPGRDPGHDPGHSDADAAVPGEPSLYSGRGRPWPFS